MELTTQSTQTELTGSHCSEGPLTETSKHDDLDAVLRTTLWWSDPGFDQLVARRRIAWWDSSRTRSWFLENGYVLYQRSSTEGDFAVDMYPLDGEQRDTAFPFAHHGAGGYRSMWNDDFPNFYGRGTEVGNIAYAQDREGRHVVIKAILSGSEEARVLEFLHRQGVPSSIDDFHHIMPIVDFLAHEGHWLAVMPRDLTLRLTFLSSQDIKKDNILVNHVHRDRFDGLSQFRMSLRFQGKLTYALFDFDGGTMFPRSMPLEKCRLPNYVSFNTFREQAPADTFQGEFDFNPFAFDVGMTGVMFCSEFQHLTPVVPMLAPLFDKMTTRKINQRFKASEALEFFEQHVVPLTTEDQLSASALEPLDYEYAAYDYYDRWKGLEPGFIERWSAFREPPVPRHVEFLRYICQYPLVYDSISYVRRAFSFVCNLACQVRR
ncbi:hypothetical protein H0H93_003160 [Arthromyces matolae]|nr:hypothetical protein H0H93_003160 [Arthromyces matolae]